MSDYLQDPSAPPEKEIAELEALLAPLAYKEDLDWERAEAARTADRAPRRRRAAVLAAALVLAAAAILVASRLWPSGPAGPSPTLASSCVSAASSLPWGVQVLGGAPSCGGTGTGADGALRVGGWIETDGSSSARLAVADVGEILVDSDSRLELTTTGPDRHRLELRRGRIHASVDAPPRLFVVGTPAAEAVDLGCEYDLVVDGDGVAHITVTDGAVSLEGGDRLVLVPAGYRARSLPERGPTPSVSVTSGDPFFEHVVAFFESRDRSVLEAILSAARGRDTLTLEGLLPLVDRDGCERVHARLIELSPTPFPWDRTDYGCHAVGELIEAWRGLLGVEAARAKE